VCCENGVDIISVVVSTDHVHIFVSIPPKLSMSDFMQKVKGRSLFLIQREFSALKKRYWGQRFWGRDYFSTTNGAIGSTIADQPEMS
jgi:putative transposase